MCYISFIPPTARLLLPARRVMWNLPRTLSLNYVCLSPLIYRIIYLPRNLGRYGEGVTLLVLDITPLPICELNSVVHLSVAQDVGLYRNCLWVYGIHSYLVTWRMDVGRTEPGPDLLCDKVHYLYQVQKSIRLSGVQLKT